MYSGCDVYAATNGLHETNVLPDVPAEKSSILAAISDGSKDFEVS